MRLLRKLLDRQGELLRSSKWLRVPHALFEATDTFLYTTGKITRGSPHVRDAVDLKRVMVTVVVALIPAMIMAMANTGLQGNLAIADGAIATAGWRGALVELLGGGGHDPANWWHNLALGGAHYLPVLAVTFAVGGFWEGLFAGVRKHELAEGFLVTGMLFPLLLPTKGLDAARQPPEAIKSGTINTQERTTGAPACAKR